MPNTQALIPGELLTPSQAEQWKQLVDRLIADDKSHMVTYVDATLNDMWRFVLQIKSQLPADTFEELRHLFNEALSHNWSTENIRIQGLLKTLEIRQPRITQQ